MNTKLLYIFTRTPLHVGAGSSVGAVDQPVQRERHTGYPIIPGSSIKGVLRDYFEIPESGDEVFGREAGAKKTNEEGKEDNGAAGTLVFTEGKLLLFPVRSVSGSYALATSKHALSRYARDCQPGLPLPEETIEAGTCHASKQVSFKNQDGENGVVLEEYAFQVKKDFPKEWEEHLSGIIDDPVLKEAKERFVLLSDEDFAHFALNACQVIQHNHIDPETGTVKNGMLFNEETVPSESLFYLSLLDMSRNEQQKEAVKQRCEHFKEPRLMQFGGKSTTGLGFCTASLGKEEA